MASEPFESCEALVRRVDSDRYLATLFAPASARPHLFALYAFNYEIAKTADIVSQPVMGQIRLQWWRDSIEEIYAGQVRAHEVVQALAEAIGAHQLPSRLFEGMIEAREKDIEASPFETMGDLESYADATSGHVMRLAAHVLGAGVGLDETARQAGIAYALTGLLRALPFHASRRRLMLAAEALNAVGISEEEIFSGTMDARVTSLVTEVAKRARGHLETARAAHVPRGFLPALLPAALVPLHLKMMIRRGFDPFRHSTEVPVYRRQIAMLGAMMRGRL